jgi:hypothetical protein
MNILEEEDSEQLNLDDKTRGWMTTLGRGIRGDVGWRWTEVFL